MYLVRVLAAAAAVVSCAVASAWADGAPKWGAHVDVEGRLGTERNLGELDLFLPLMQSARTLLFADVRGHADDDGSSEGNFGLALRHMLPSGWNIGAYGYYDRRRTDLDNYFDQATFGLEALGRDFDFRANAYLPFGERAKDAGSTAGGGSFASIVGTTIEVTTLGGTLREERALQGFDAEVGWRVPIWSADANKALRLYAGIFHFDDSVVEAITGPRLRAELTMYEVPYLPEDSRLTLGAEYLDDDVRGGQGFAIARLRIPLQSEQHTERSRSWQERRMTDYVQRDVDIVTQKHTAQRASLVETATATADGKDITVIDSATTSGAALRGAVAAAGDGSSVLLSGTFDTTTPVEVQTNQTLTGTATVTTASGHTATINTGAAINATNATRVVTIASGGTLSGLTITATNNGLGAYGVIVDANASNITIENNVISVLQTGNNGGVAFAINATPTSATHNLVVRNNTITATGTGSATAMTAIAANSISVEIMISGNTLSASGGSVLNNIVWSNLGTTIMPGSTGNIRGSGNCSGTPASGAVEFTNGTSCP